MAAGLEFLTHSYQRSKTFWVIRRENKLREDDVDSSRPIGQLQWQLLRLIFGLAGVAVLSMIQGNYKEIVSLPHRFHGAQYEKLRLQAFTPDLVRWMIENQDVRAQLQTAPGSPRVDLMADHGWAYATWMRWALTSPSHGHAVLIHVDTHPDTRDLGAMAPAPSTPEEADPIEYDIASFIWPAVLHGAVDEFYWVFNPRWGERGDEGDHPVWVCTVKDAHGLTAPVVLFQRKKPDLEAARAKALKQMRLSFKEAPETLSVLVPDKPILVHFVPVSALPDFMNESRPVILDFDFDFWQDSRSLRQYPNTSSTLSVGRSIANDIRTLARKHVKPAVVDMALSDGFTPRDSMFRIGHELTRQLEGNGLLTFERGTNGEPLVRLESNSATCIPDIRALRAAFEQRRWRDVMHLSNIILARYGAKADEEERRHPGGLDPLLIGDPSDLRWDQPAPPALLDFRELNAAAEAIYVRARLFEILDEKDQATQTMLVLAHRFPNAFIGVSAYGDFANSRGEWDFRVFNPWFQKVYASRMLRSGSWKDLPAAKLWNAHDRQFAIQALQGFRDGFVAESDSPMTDEDLIRSGEISAVILNALDAEIDRDIRNSGFILPDPYALRTPPHSAYFLRYAA